MSILMIPKCDVTKEQKDTCSLRELYDKFFDICKENSKNNPCDVVSRELSKRTIKGYLEEEIYERGIKELGKSKISNFDIFFFDWLFLGKDTIHKDAVNSVGVSHSVDEDQLLKENSIYFYPNSSPIEIVSYIKDEEEKAKQNGMIGIAAFHGFDNNGDPYINNLRSSNQVPFGNQQVNVTQPDPSIQNNGDEIVPYQFNFAKQRFTSPEEVLNSVMGVNNQNQQIQMYQQPMYIDQWGNVVYYNPQQF